MNKNHQPMANKNQVWMAGKFWIVETKSQTDRVGNLPDRNLWRGILSTNPRHIRTSRCATDPINH